MTRITDLTEASSLAQTDSVAVDGASGTRKLSMMQAFGRLADTFSQNSYFHRNIYRGKSLGKSFTSDQKNAIRSGTFDDLYIGDYWTDGGTDWLITDMDYWYGIGRNTATLVKTHHINIIPRLSMGTSVMNSTATNAGGYAAAQIRAKFSPIVSQVNNFFGSGSILNAPRTFSTDADSGMATAMNWIDNCTCELMSERMVYGSPVFEIQNGKPASSSNQNSAFAWNHTNDLNQLALFRLAPRFRMAVGDGQVDNGWWLNTMAKWDHFCCCIYGRADCLPANTTLGIRPIMGITG
jgi:hypothetical protein